MLFFPTICKIISYFGKVIKFSLLHLYTGKLWLFLFSPLSFSCLNALVQASSTIASRSAKNGHLCHISDLKTECLVLFSNSHNVYIVFIMLRYAEIILCLSMTYTSKAFSVNMKIIMWFLFLWCITFIDLHKLNPQIYEMKLTLSQLIFLMWF